MAKLLSQEFALKTKKVRIRRWHSQHRNKVLIQFKKSFFIRLIVEVEHLTPLLLHIASVLATL